jgi:hypothetical protein
MVFAELKDPVRARIEGYELTRTIDPVHFVPTIGDDVTAFREQFGVDWTRTPASRPDDPGPSGPVGASHLVGGMAAGSKV